MQEDGGAFPEARKWQRCPLPRPVTQAGEEGGSRWPAGCPQVPALSDRPSGLLDSGHPPAIGPSVLARSSATPAPGGRTARSGWRWGRPCCQPRRTRKMLLLSPALIWHWLPGEGGPEAAAAARPRPPGIFERCSWVREGGRRGRGGWAGPPNPPPKKEGASRGGEGRGCHSVWPLSSRPRRTPGAARPRPGPAPASPVDRQHGRGAMLQRLPGQAAPRGLSPGSLAGSGIEATLFPCPALQRSRRGQHPGCFTRGRPGPTTPGAPAQGCAADRLTPVAAGAVLARSPDQGFESSLVSTWPTDPRSSSPSLGVHSHKEGDNQSHQAGRLG